jgi:N-carbamoylputrescine amidase
MNTERDRTLTVALIGDVFFGADGEARLHARLAEAASRGADLAVLPELPLDPWVPATRDVREEDAEPPGGPRASIQGLAARAAGIGLVGGAIIRDPTSGLRHNTALLFDARGTLIAAYQKMHLPEEPGFWETSHYVAGDRTPEVVRAFGMPIGLQICSDANRPEVSHVLGAAGAEIVLVPRATEAGTWNRWKLVLTANAITSTTYVLSVNRRDRLEVPLGGPSVAIDPHGRVIAESLDSVVTVTLSGAVVAEARRAYPGYLPVRTALYARGWRSLASAALTASAKASAVSRSSARRRKRRPTIDGQS